MAAISLPLPTQPITKKDNITEPWYRYFTQLTPNPDWSLFGTLNITTTSIDTLEQGFVITQSGPTNYTLPGAVPAEQGLNEITITGYQAISPPAGFGSGLFVDMTVGGGDFRGVHAAGFFKITQDTASNVLDTYGNIVGLQSQAIADCNNNGTGVTLTNSSGAAHAFAAAMSARSNATNWTHFDGCNIDVALEAGCSARYITGYNIGKVGTIQGNLLDAAFNVTGPGTWKTIFCISDFGATPVDSGTTILGGVSVGLITPPWTANYGIDFRNFSFSTAAIALPASGVISANSITSLTFGTVDPVFGLYSHAFDFGSNNFPLLTLRNTSGGAGGPGIFFYHNTASPAINDTIGQFICYGKDSGGADQRWGAFYCNTVNVTAGGSEASMWVLETQVANVATNVATFQAGIQVGAPTGGDKGVGSINVAADIYKNNLAYANPDYALEHYYTGKIEKFASNDGASEYHGLPSLSSIEEHMRSNLRLPGISDRPMGAFERSDKALEKIEEAWIYISQLHNRVTELENRQIH